MSNKLINLALAKSIYSEKKNYLETFSPFVLKILYEEKKQVSISSVDELLRKLYSLKIPLNTLKSIFSLLANHKYAELEKKTNSYLIKISKNGEKYHSESIENEKIIQRRQNKLLTEFITFVRTKYKFEYNIDMLDAEIICFIDDNIVDLISFTFENSDKCIPKEHHNGFSFHFNEFLIEIEKSNNELFESFQELLKGAILWNEIAKRDEGEKEIVLDNLTIYLDANYLLCLLGLDYPPLNKAAQQLFDLLKRNKNITLKVLKVTLDEIVRLLSEFKRQQTNYFNVPVNNIYYFLKSSGYDDVKIDLFIKNLDKKCIELGLELENCELLNLEKINDKDQEIYAELYQYNLNLNKQKVQRPRGESAIHHSTLHDASVLSIIRKKRGVWVKSLEKSKAIFLTSSYRLNNFVNNRAQKINSFPETVLDLTITNILWLKNPSDDIGCSVRHIISVHSKNYFVNDGIWRTFTANVNELKKENKISDEDYAHLISNNQMIVDFLRRNSIDKITHKNILELRDKLISDELERERELLKSKNLIQDKDSKLEKINQQASSLQSQLDKAKNSIQVEKKDKEIINKELKNLKHRIDLDDYNKIRIEDASKQTLIDLKRIKRDFWKTISWGSLILLICFIAYEIVGSDDFKSFLGLSTFFTLIIKAFIGFLVFILTNWIISKEIKKTIRWIFKRKKLQAEFYDLHFTEYSKNNPAPKLD